MSDRVLFTAGEDWYPSDLRKAWETFNEGIIDDGLEVTAGTTGLSVDVAAGVGFVEGDEDPDQGLYRINLEAPLNSSEFLAGELDDADPDDPRLDQIIARVYDDEYDSSGSTTWRLEVVTGTPTTGATLGNRNGAAALPDTAMLLADVLVPAAASELDSEDLNDRRQPASAAGIDPGLLPTADQKAAMDAAESPDAGNPFATIDDLGGGGGGSLAIADPDSPPSLVVDDFATDTLGDYTLGGGSDATHDGANERISLAGGTGIAALRADSTGGIWGIKFRTGAGSIASVPYLFVGMDDVDAPTEFLQLTSVSSPAFALFLQVEADGQAESDTDEIALDPDSDHWLTLELSGSTLTGRVFDADPWSGSPSPLGEVSIVLGANALLLAQSGIAGFAGFGSSTGFIWLDDFIYGSSPSDIDADRLTFTGAGDTTVTISEGDPGDVTVEIESTGGGGGGSLIVDDGSTEVDPVTELLVGGSNGISVEVSDVGGGVAGLGISGAGIDAIPETLIDAEGDLIVGGAADTAGRLAAGATGEVLRISGSGVPIWGDEVGIPETLINAAGDLVVGTADDTAARLAIGSAGEVLTVTGGAPTWEPLPDAILETLIDAAGDLIVGTADDTAAILAAGSEGEVLTIESGVPSWEALPAVDAIAETLIAAAGDLVVGTADDTAGILSIGSNGEVLTVTGGAPSWEALPAIPDALVIDDGTVEVDPLSRLNVTGAGGIEADVVDDGSGEATLTIDGSGVAGSGGLSESLIDAAGDLIVGSADDTAARLAAGTAGEVLTIAGGVPSWEPLPDAILETLINAAGDLVVGTADDTAGILSAGSEGEVLTIESGVPAWAAATGGGIDGISVDDGTTDVDPATKLSVTGAGGIAVDVTDSTGGEATLEIDGSGIDAIAETLIGAAGDLVVGTADDTADRLAVGTAGEVLTVAGGVPSWEALPDSILESLIDAAGDLIVGSADNTAARLAAGSNAEVLTIAGGVPSWEPLPTIPDALVVDDGTTEVDPVSRLNVEGTGGIAVDLTDDGSGEATLEVDGAGIGMFPGAVWASARSDVPTGWLLCNGQAVSRTTYADLFAAIGTTHGVGNGSTTFNVPDIEGRVIAGRDTGQSEFNTLGETGGAKTHTLTEAEMPEHTHTFSLPRRAADDAGLSTGLLQLNPDSTSGNFTTNETGGDGAHNNLQPYITLNYLIKT